MSIFDIVACPYCGKTMDEGAIHCESGSGVFWLPKNRNLGFINTKKSIEKKEGIVLDGPFLTRFHTSNITSYACKTCKKIVIDV